MYNIKGCLYDEDELINIVMALGLYLDILEGKIEAPEVPEEIKHTKIQYDIEELKNYSEDLSYLKEQLTNRVEHLDLVINILDVFAKSSFTKLFYNIFNNFKKKKMIERKHIHKELNAANKSFAYVINQRISYKYLKEFYNDAVAAIEEAHTSAYFTDDMVATATCKFDSNIVELKMNRK